MLEFLRSISKEPYDTITFISGDKKDSLEVMTNCYRDSGTKLGGSELGDTFDIILFREDVDGKLIEPDKFEAILMEPLEYISTLIKGDWYGIVARKTTTSQKFVNEIFDKLIEVLYNRVLKLLKVCYVTRRLKPGITCRTYGTNLITEKYQVGRTVNSAYGIKHHSYPC